jgi:acetyltransferase-like isoleucine patch superfamily enzyme
LRAIIGLVLLWIRVIELSEVNSVVHVIESPYNMGLVSSIVKGVTEVVNEHGKVIVLEDDQVTSKGFLKYMNEALELYKDDEQVMHVSGYMYPAEFECEETTFFLNVQSCPGWGTWKRAWDHYNHDAADHLEYFSQSEELRTKFDIEGHAYFYRQLKRNVECRDFSWAVRWYASCLRAGGLSLFPVKSLVRNIGLDGTGEHCEPTTRYDVEPVDYLEIERIPLVENTEVRKSVDEFYREQLRKGPSYSSISELLGSVLRELGVRIRGGLRWSLRKIYPEVAVLDENSPEYRSHSRTTLDSAISQNSVVCPPYSIRKSSIGDYTYVSRNASISLTRIGKFCSIGPNLSCGHGVHPVDGISTAPMFYSTAKQNGTTLSNYNKVEERKPIHIGNDVFIGMNVTILDGVTIGDGAVIGAGTVVSKDVPSYAIVVGNPMRILRYRFSEEIIEKLLEIAWWDWSIEKLQRVEEHFLDVEGFVEACKEFKEDAA